MLSTKKKANVIKKVQVHATDTGSADVQIGLLTRRIEELSEHLKKNRKDNHSRRGLLQMISTRRKHVKYLGSKSKKRLATVSTTLGL
jgi:small subunit ribosomal protein S15